jgi:VIT1/CCC1 family predicted Fe2+/Mn2+ transporter
MMSSVPVPMLRGPSSSTYYDFYFGYGLSSTVTLLALAALFWILGNQAESNRAAVRNLLIPLLCAMIGYAVVDFIYFFAVPAITCTLTALCIAVSIVQLSKK